MNVTHIFKHQFTYEYWTLNTSTTGATDFAKAFEGKASVLAGASGWTLITDTQLLVPNQIRNIKDSAGTNLLVSGTTNYPMYITRVEPQFDPFGQVYAWKHALTPDLPKKYSEFLSEAITLAGTV